MSKKSSPNILWICTDQQRWDTLGAYGNEWVQTPVADQLAREGVLFENAYCQSPVCTPSRASFLTGRYPRTTRCRANGQDIPDTEVLVTRLLSDAGYVCGLSGKLHLSACNPSANIGTEKRINDGYDDFYWSHDPLPLWPTNQYIQWLTEKNIQFEDKPFEGSSYVSSGMPVEHHQTTWCAEKAITFMKENAKHDHPWCFSVNIFDPHHPFDPPPEMMSRYLDISKNIPLPNYVAGELDNKPAFQQNDHIRAYNTEGLYNYESMKEDDHRLVRAAYWAMCDLIDIQLGRMLATLKEIEQLENTIVIFMSDHGEMLGDHGIYLKGPYFYEPAIRVPLIISMPGIIQQNVRSNALVELTDVAPTLLEAAGLDPDPGMQGRSLWRILKGFEPVDKHREDIYCEFYSAMTWHKDPAAEATMLRTATHKLVVVHSLDCGELYDLVKDPNETNNLWDDPGHLDIKSKMLTLLSHRMAATVDPLPLCRAKW
ncbi:sulfatase family protein [Rubellicoccus peritrichatus]|uniref:Sulfatase-like hydrolase/transferase n=1 Tax=Rubellicoccus peritrichatus TaxID=3080537 RepID=A0AAQ3QR79_9BACT|nr:sulfatase-like hydrolase/transferase [Puniceicoccus sp. CR14]WOO41033.1 sulfatase-like hydrolase/transferase [Puniceicoccus sp. CR14]